MVGIWDISDAETLCYRIERIVTGFCTENSFDNGESMELEEIVVFGSFGRGTGTIGSSDLDVMVLVDSTADRRNNAYSEYMAFLAERVESQSGTVLSGFEDLFDGLDVVVYPWMERDSHLMDFSETHDRNSDVECLAYSFDSGKIRVLHP